MIKIAFFDIDGTLLKYEHKKMSKNTILALRKLKENGVLLCMATGRGYSTIPRFKEIEFDVLLTFNGSYIKNKEGIIFQKPLDINDKNIIINNLKRMDRAIAISNENMIVTNGTDDDLEQYFSFANLEMTIADNFEELCKNDIYQIMCSCVKEEYEIILQGTTKTKITAWWDSAIDIIPADCDKGNGINKVLKYYGISKDEAIAFGDGMNDIEMLESVGIGVAMENAKEEVKVRANMVCKSVEEDGVYYYCLENGLI